jgi:hypothetical protein
MNKVKTILLITAFLPVLFSCNDPFLMEPHLPGGGNVSARGIAPEGVRASQGEKRRVTLSWNEDPNAVLYYIYKAENPLNTFERCGETKSTQFEHPVPSGSALYYRVSSVSYNGTESLMSVYVTGTSLAQPVISDITGITESSAVVTWYMDNVSEDSYKNNLLYTVYCYNGDTEVAQKALDGSAISENQAEFTGLAPNTPYKYVVEAYLRGDQNAVEKSDKVDAVTARRFRPGAPVKFRGSRGTAIDKVTLNFELPDMVDIALGDNQYEPKPVYFVIYRRFYNESGTNEYEKACSYFGSMPNKGEQFAGGYIPGAKVTWIDWNISRGVKYEYLVQSYVDGTPKVISSDTSKSEDTGWALSEGSLSLGDVEYTLGVGLYESAKLPLDFEFDPQDESYDYVLKEKIEPIDDADTNDPDGIIGKEFTFNTYDAVRAYIPEMDLTQKTTETNSGRGLYSYVVEIRLNNVLLDTISTIGKAEVSENTEKIIVENFRVQDGYTDKFVLKWTNYSNRKYTIYIVDDKGVIVQEITSVNENPSGDDVDTNYSYSYTANGVTTGVTRYFAIRPFRDPGTGVFKPGQMVYAPASRTLGVPQASLGGESTYSAITAAWTEAQKADTYRVKYRYTGDAVYKTAATIKKEALSLAADGKYKYAFKPEGNEIDIAKAGLEIQVQVDALNEGLRTAIGGGEISTSSAEDVKTRLVGPALLGLSASRAASSSEITVSWNKISGAYGYYVFRREFNMNNTEEAGSEYVAYYVPADAQTLTGKNLKLDSNAKIDTATVKASVTLGSQYTLKDFYMPDGDYNGLYNSHTTAYRNQQNDMAQGCPYRYWVVPVINGAALNSIEFVYKKNSGNKNTDIDYYTIQDNNASIKYTGAASLEKEGFTIGFGQNVTATKGTYASSGNVNNGIKITWSPPPRLSTVSGFNPRYTVYRRESGGSTWETLKSDINALEYIENQLVGTLGNAYEYVVGISASGGNSDPKSSNRFIDLCYTQLDEKGRPKMLGFMLDMVKMDSVSRNEQKVGNEFAEEVKWKSAGIKHRNGVGNKWGIDGYEVYVMNRNINAAWHKITEIAYANIPDQIDQSVKVTTGMGSVTLSTTAGNMSFDLLRVMRDYRHFFKVRNYVINEDGARIYSADPPYTYKYYYAANDLPLFESVYVKWGARQVTPKEFGIIAMVYMCDGIDQVNGTAWNTAYNGFPIYAAREQNANGDGTSGKVRSESNFGVTSWDFQFTNYKTDLQVRTGEWQHFVTINGKTWAGTNASNQYPQRWGYAGAVSVIGPSDTPGLYTGEITLGGGRTGYSDLYWGSGDVSVKYPPNTAEQKIIARGENTPMLFSGHGDRRYQQDAWR